MKILITGHTGFIGRHLYKYLQRFDIGFMDAVNSYVPVGYSRSTGHDIFNTEQLGKYVGESGMVYHLAAYTNPGESIVRPVQTIMENVKGTLNVFEACREHGKPLVYVSTCEVYGNAPYPAKEGDELKPTNPYAASKAMCDRMCYAYHKSYGLDVRVVRLFNPYGPGQHPNKIITRFYNQAKSGKPITVYGDGSDFRDYVYIGDTVTGLWKARKIPAGTTINVCTGRKTTALQIAEKIKKMTGSKSKIKMCKYPKKHGGIRQQVGSTSAMETYLEWRPPKGIDEGLRRTIEWLKT